MSHLVDTWSQQVYTIDPLKPYHRPGVARSFPVLAHNDESLILVYFFYEAELVGPLDIQLKAPDFFVEVDTSDFSLVGDGGFDLEPFETQVYHLSEVDKEANGQRVAWLKEQYDILAERFPNQPAEAYGPQFAGLLEKVVPPLLWPYYRSLSPAFWNWLDNA